MSSPMFVALTGGPCGGKSAFIEELSRQPGWAGRFTALPEAISLMKPTGLTWRDKAFQVEMVRLQMRQEDDLLRQVGPASPRLVLCDRGSLDPHAYWILAGWPEMDFFDETSTTDKQHFQRYRAVIHLVSAADGAEEHYLNRPHATRSETPQQAVRIDRMLEHVWRRHPHYHWIDNAGVDWPAKTARARQILEDLLD